VSRIRSAIGEIIIRAVIKRNVVLLDMDDGLAEERVRLTHHGGCDLTDQLFS
jgi:hypothetical protein